MRVHIDFFSIVRIIEYGDIQLEIDVLSTDDFFFLKITVACSIRKDIRQFVKLFLREILSTE